MENSLLALKNIINIMCDNSQILPHAPNKMPEENAQYRYYKEELMNTVYNFTLRLKPTPNPVSLSIVIAGACTMFVNNLNTTELSYDNINITTLRGEKIVDIESKKAIIEALDFEKAKEGLDIFITKIKQENREISQSQELTPEQHILKRIEKLRNGQDPNSGSTYIRNRMNLL